MQFYRRDVVYVVVLTFIRGMFLACMAVNNIRALLRNRRAVIMFSSLQLGVTINVGKYNLA